MKESPIIVIGMHRSGTSMLTRLLQRMGVFWGAAKDENNEARFFLKISRWMMSLTGASWDNPSGMEYLLKQPKAMEQVVERTQAVIFSMYAYQYFGMSRFLKYRSVSNISERWGWKVPENVFTLPVWMEIFPDAYVIDINRHGVDVANSLAVREEEVLEQNKRKRNVFLSKISSLMPLVRGGMYSSPRCMDIAGGFSLWEEYMEKVRESTKDLPNYYELQYEDLLKEPKKEMKGVLEFLDMEVEEDVLSSTVERIDPKRAYAYKRSPKLKKYAKSVDERLRKYGYKA